VTNPGPPGQPYGDYPSQGDWQPANPYGTPDPYGPYGSPPPQYGPPPTQPQPGYQQPSYEQPGYQQPSYEQPSYEQPGYQQPGYQQPSYQPPGYEQPAYPQSPYQPSPYGAPPPKKGSSGLLIGVIAGVVLLVLALCGVGVWALMKAGQNSTTTSSTPGLPTATHYTPGATPTTPGVGSTDPADAQVGSCLAGETLDSASAKPVNDMSVVDCSSSGAKYKVVGIVHNISESKFNSDDHLCDAYPSAKSALWEGTSSSGEVLCLEPLH
jgi:hypothetical protein